jgi:GAF domain-containing protein/HAMP domain-containing protein
MEETTSQKFDHVDPQKRSRNALTISIVTGALLTLSLIAVLLIGGPAGINIISLVTLLLCIVASALSVWLSRRGNSDLGIGILIVALIVTAAADVFVEKGQAIPTGITNIIVVSGIATFALSQKWASRAVIASFTVALSTIILDQFTTAVPASATPQVSTLISLVLGLIYFFVIAVQFKNFSLRNKLITGFLLLTTIPIAIIGWQTYSTTRTILETQIKADILRSSLSTSFDFQTFLDSQFNTIHDQARATEVIDYMSLSQAERKIAEKQQPVSNALADLYKNKPTYINSYALIDNNGIDIIDTNHSNLGVSYADQKFFTYIIANKKPYTSSLIVSKASGLKSVYFAVPVLSKSGAVLGIFAVAYNPSIIQSTIQQISRNNRAPETEYSYIIDDANFLILGHTIRLDLLYKTYLGLNDPKVKTLEAQGLINKNNLRTSVLPQPEIVAQLSKMEATTSFRAPSQEYDGGLAEVASVRLNNSNWIVVTARPLSTVALITQSQTRSNVVVSVIITMLAALIAVIASNLFTSPIIQLTRVAEIISTGDFTHKAEVRLNDEIGVLARTFNGMTDQIQGLVSNLESRVEQRTVDLKQRTSDLQQVNVQSDKRAHQLETIAEISRYISTEKDQEKLLPLITQIVSERLGFYHVGIFLLDEKGKFAILRAANSPGGQIMLRRKHKLEVGQTGIVGNVTSTGKPRIALDTGADAVYFNNPDLVATRSEMALPLSARGTIIGALDVQSTVSNAFSDEDVSIISLLADQVAIAIDNVRLLAEARSALAESQSVFSEYLTNAWQKKSESAITGYYQTPLGGKLITAQNSPNEVNASTEHKNSALAIPILVRDQVIGTLNILPNNEGRTWSTDEVNIAQAVTERLGLALDNARLFEETSTRASRERLVSDITTRIRGTNDPQEMIKTAVEELQRALGATRVEIVPQKISHPTDK